ncbi:MAG: thiamine pyrophosphate-dependent enzyme, partial [Candidatus Thermoplasmatota archaeon]|nr:thiamine pyrophosphate-dependent enzyme [Candidatus Thermoplasmatota archaeon]
MFNKADHIREKYLELNMYPSIFCTGCGIGNVLNYSLRALDAEKIDLDKTVFVSGIGCSSRLPGYIDADGLHTTHGRALAFATGIKTADPDLHVVIFTGDGDAAGIGGNHLIHAARRNVDLTVICVNNFTYGMTGGQVSPTTPVASKTTTTPYGNVELPFDLCDLVIGAGASYVARWTLGYPYETIRATREAAEISSRASQEATNKAEEASRSAKEAAEVSARASREAVEESIRATKVAAEESIRAFEEAISGAGPMGKVTEEIVREIAETPTTSQEVI